jgi:hypothetical protein
MQKLCHLYGEWLLPGNCPLTPAGYIRRPFEELLGKTYCQKPLSGGLSAVCQMIGMEQKMIPCRGKIIKKLFV